MKKIILPILLILFSTIGFYAGRYFNSNVYELVYIYNHDKDTYYWEELLLLNKQTGEIRVITNYGGNSVPNGKIIYKP